MTRERLGQLKARKGVLDLRASAKGVTQGALFLMAMECQAITLEIMEATVRREIGEYDGA